METLLRRADEALYRAKKKGGMRVCACAPEPLPLDM
jgi:PleD family two-component response regulator